MKKYAKVIVRNNSIYTDNLFTYEVPDFLENELEVGHRVLVPFGRGNKPTEAFVFEITTTIEEDIKTKDVIDLLDEKPIFKIEDLELVRWMKNRYLCTYIDCINLIYPKGYKLNNYNGAILNLDLEKLQSVDLYEENSDLNENEKLILDELINNKGMIKIDKFKKIKNINNILDKMKRKNIIDIKWEYKDHKNEKKICYVSLGMDKDYVDDYIHGNKINLGNKQKEIVEFLKHNSSVEINDLLEIINASKQSVTSLIGKNLITLEIKDYYRSPEDIYRSDNKKITLNEEQEYAVHKITSEMFNESKNPYMIHGVTGSGKTEVYMEIIDYALNQGLDSIVLVPEIALTPQTISRFKNRFGDIVGVFHSKLSEGEKHDVYKAIKLGKIRILIGARSALFAPFNSLGVVIIDEFHEGAYKSEKNPKFSAIEVARY
ncbi:MAG: DEAD/DEAH box helicase family protein, partial [Peptostreptococcaceae bacterium]|nr:DEAD/DEAH box helicase family protein [Peptostreptococcaceae bacterium]